jgi:raffinose/stachyose/melibiose transport system permease protein
LAQSAHAAPDGGTKRFELSARAQRRLTIFLFLIVPVFSLIVFNIYPVLQLFYISLTNFNGIDWLRAHLVGDRNYVNLFGFESDLMWPIVNSLYYLVGSIVQIVLACWFAVVLNQKLPGSRLFRTILFLPFVLNSVAAALVFRHLLELDGTLNDLMHAIFGPGVTVPWLNAAKDYTNFSLAAASVWRYLGFNLVVTFGALQSIPEDQYDAARLEGANGWQSFWRITFPSIRPVLLLQFALSVVGSLEVFEIPLLITGGAGKTSTFAIEMIQTGFQFRRAGTAAAMAVIMLAIVAVVFAITRLTALRSNPVRTG